MPVTRGEVQAGWHRHLRRGGHFIRSRALAARVAGRNPEVVAPAVGQSGHRAQGIGDICHPRNARRCEVGHPGKARLGIVKGIAAGFAGGRPGRRYPGVARDQAEATRRGRRHGGYLADQAEAVAVAATVANNRLGTAAGSRAQRGLLGIPVPAAHHALVASRAACARAHGAAVGGRTAIAVGVAVLNPLLHIAVQVVQAKKVGRKAANRHGSCPIGNAAGIAGTAQGTGIVGLAATDAGAKGVRRRRAGARRVFPFRLRGQAVGVAGLRAQPRRIHLGLVPTDVDHRPHTPTPALIFGPIDPGLGAGKAIVVRKGHFIPAHGHTPIEADRAQRPFIAAAAGLAGRRSHAEITRRQQHHLWPLAAVFQRVAKDPGRGRGGRRPRGGQQLGRGRALANRVGGRDHKVIGPAVRQVGHGVRRAGNIRYPRHVGARGEVADPGQAGCGVIKDVGAGAADFAPGGRHPGVARGEIQAAGRGRRRADGRGRGLAGGRAFANGVAGRDHNKVGSAVAEPGERMRRAAEIGHPRHPARCSGVGDPGQAGFRIVQDVSAGIIDQWPGGRHLGVAGDEAQAARHRRRARGDLRGDADLGRGRALAGRVFRRDHKEVLPAVAQPDDRVRGAAKTGHPRAARQAAVDGRGRGVHRGKTLPGVVQGVAAGVRHLRPGGRRPRVARDETQAARRGQRRGGGVRDGGTLAGGRALAAGVGGRYGKKVAPAVD